MTAKVTATTKRPKAGPKPPAEQQAPSDGEFPVLRLKTRDQAEQERVPLFYIDDVEYTIPKRPRMNVGLQFLHLSRDQDDSAAMDYLLAKLLGEDGYRALREYDDLTAEQFQQITEIASRLTLGALELPKA